MSQPKIIPSQRLFARVVATLWADGQMPDFQTTDQPHLELTFEGIPHDRHAGFLRRADARTPHYPRGTPIRNIRQLSIVSTEELAEIAVRLGLPELLPQWLGANIVLAGLPDLSFLPRGTRLAFPGGAALAAEGYNRPCLGTGRKVHEAAPSVTPQEFVKAASRLRGIVASVERPGEVRAGDSVEVHVPEQWLYA